MIQNPNSPFFVKVDLSNFVTLDTNQTITGQKTLTSILLFIDVGLVMQANGEDVVELLPDGSGNGKLILKDLDGNGSITLVRNEDLSVISSVGTDSDLMIESINLILKILGNTAGEKISIINSSSVELFKIDGVGLSTFVNTVNLKDATFKSGSFKVLVESLVLTADRTQSLQDKSGTIALLSDTVKGNFVEKWTLYNSTLNGAWDTVVIADALPDSLIQIVCVNNSGNNDMGVRMVSSVLDRKVLSVGNSSLTMTVKTNNLKEIEVYASSFLQVDFFFESQL